MKRVYIHYSLWEDYINGMWRKESSSYENANFNDIISFCKDHIQYGIWMNKVVLEWPNTMLNSLTNPSVNKQAFIGHCACCLYKGWPEYLVRMAWKRLTNIEMQLANNQADMAYKKWRLSHEEKNRELYSKMGSQMLF